MDKTFEEKYKKIEEILQEIESNKDNLDMSIKLYEKAKDLYRELENSLTEYKAKVEIIENDQ